MPASMQQKQPQSMRQAMSDLIFVVLALLAWSALSFWVGYMVGWGRCFKELKPLAATEQEGET